MNGIKRPIHPNRGLIPSGNQIRREARQIHKESASKRSHEIQEDPHIPKTKPPPTRENDYPIHITMDNNQMPTTSTEHIEQNPTGLMDLPIETI